MKNISTILLLVTAGLSAHGQIFSGKVSYNEKIILDIQVNAQIAQFAEMIPKEQNIKKELLFSPEASIYRDAPPPEKTNKDLAENTMIKVHVSTSNDKIYHDLKENKSVSQKEFMSRKFLITDENPKPEWKLTGVQKKILNYSCQQATMEKDTTKITAWFTPDIPVTTGPDDWWGLPGLILEVQEGQNHSLEAISVEVGEQDKNQIVKPTGGKKVSEKEYEELVKEKTKEMQEQYGTGPGKNVMIRINH